MFTIFHVRIRRTIEVSSSAKRRGHRDIAGISRRAVHSNDSTNKNVLHEMARADLDALSFLLSRDVAD